MPALLDALLDVFADVRALRLRHRRGLATQPEALRALSALEVLDEPNPSGGGTMWPLIRAVREILDSLPPRSVGVVWRSVGAWLEGEPEVVVVRDDTAARTTLVAAAHVSPSRVRRVAAAHLTTDELVAFAECHHRHADGLEHRHHEELHAEVEAAEERVAGANGLRERTAAVEAQAAAESRHADVTVDDPE